MAFLKVAKAVIKFSPVVIVAAQRAWPYIAKTLQENPQLAVSAKDKVAALSRTHRRATVEDVELRLAALTLHVESMDDTPGALVVDGAPGVTRGEALSRIAQIDAAVHSLDALTAKARPAALRRISYELDRLATQTLIPQN